MAGNTSGSVMRLSVRSTPEPLMTADSSSEGSIERKAADIMRKAMGE